MPVKPQLIAAALAVASSLPMPASALGLVDVWQAASRQDPGIAAARAAGAAGDARRQQADALWRPVVALEGGASLASSESQMRGAQVVMGGPAQNGVSFNTSITGGTSTRIALSARQPIWNAERSAQAKQLQNAADAAGIEWGDAQQALMLQSAERYFAVALAARRLELLKRQLDAVDKALVEAKDRFALGDRPVIDVHEAKARAEALRAQRSALETELELARVALADSSGLSAQPEEFSLPSQAVASDSIGQLQAWLDKADQSNALLRLMNAQLQNARLEVDKTRGQWSPTLDVVAQTSRDRLSGSGDFGSASNTMTNHAIGVQLSLPLYTGGMRNARQSEAAALADKAAAEVERTRLQVAQQVKSAWLNLKVGADQLQALEAAAQASDARLDATVVGRDAGDRTMLDQLNAENDAAAAKLALAQARVSLLLGRLRLALLAGELDAALLARADRLRSSD